MFTRVLRDLFTCLPTLFFFFWCVDPVGVPLLQLVGHQELIFHNKKCPKSKKKKKCWPFCASFSGSRFCPPPILGVSGFESKSYEFFLRIFDRFAPESAARPQRLKNKLPEFIYLIHMCVFEWNT